MLNLILNAEHAMRAAHGGGKLVLRTLLVDSNVVLDVHDDGPGIPAKLAGRVFEPFFSTKGVGEGTGLGLSIALGIAEAHGGLLAIVPTDSGACFRLTIPGAQPAESDAAASDAPGLARRVLVADDEPVVRAMLQRMLRRRGFSVEMAVDGEVAMSLVETRRYDLLFCDVKLPKMGGLALYARISDRYPSAVRGFVFVSSDRLDADSQTFIDRTRIPLLSNPFSADRLDDLINRLLALTTV
jgi:CheY-like chemotaxis protein